MHNHALKPKKCNHDLKFCDHCDTVYCEKCKEEWKKEIFNIPTVWTDGSGTIPSWTVSNFNSIQEEPCMFDGVEPNTPMWVSCNCSKCSPRM